MIVITTTPPSSFHPRPDRQPTRPQLLLPGHQSPLKRPCPRHSQMSVVFRSPSPPSHCRFRNAFFSPRVGLIVVGLPDHAEKLHDLPDEYLAVALPIAKKIAIAQGAENYNILQVRALPSLLSPLLLPLPLPPSLPVYLPFFTLAGISDPLMVCQTE
jgi:hypothetical protein